MRLPFFVGARKKSNARLACQSAVSQAFIVRREKVYFQSHLVAVYFILLIIEEFLMLRVAVLIPT